jgi:hypothetical protein
MRRRIPKQARRAITVVVLATLALAASAQAATPPAVTTGAARSVTYSSALITGSVNPKGSETYYYVQYGATKAYGAQTASSRAGAGTHTITVSVPLAGLQPLTVYHYRLVAVNSGGASMGSDASFLTPKVPLSLAIASAPNPVFFGGSITIAGTLSGTGNGGRAVVLQGDQFPYTAGFQNLGNAQLTSPSGAFSFPILALSLVTQYRVVALTSPEVVSPVVVEYVAVRVESHIGRARRAHYVRFYGTVTPAENGMQVGILRLVHGRGVLVGGTTLRPASNGRSSFSKVVRARHGAYHVLVRVTSGAQVSAYGPTIRIG